MLRSRTTRVGALGLVSIVSGAACGGPEAEPFPTRDCAPIVWAFPANRSAHVEVIGSFNNWATPGLPMPPFEDEGWRMARLDVPPGEHGYLIVEGETRRLDKYNPLTTYRGAEEVSFLLAPDCSAPELRIDAVDATDAGDLTVRATLLARPGGPALDAGSVTAKTLGGQALSVAGATPGDGSILLRASGLPRGKHTVIVEAADAAGRRAEPRRAAAWVRPAARRGRDGLLYHLMVDRFRGDGGAALAPPKTPGSRASGTLSGVSAEIERGTFDELGVTTLWISPVYVNPEEPREDSGGHMIEGYHGYWPLDSRGVDARIGGAEALTSLVTAAHARGIRVLLDLVPNHVYETNPRYAEHSASGWFNDGPDSCVCGSPGCSWADRIQTCWFAPYLPDVRWQHPDAMRAGVADTLFWSLQFDVDGFRIDAVPMMPRAATRRIAAALRADTAPRDANLVLGEVFTGPGEGGINTIRYYLGDAVEGLDSAVDFPLMWALRDALRESPAGFEAVEATIREEERAYAGSGVAPARILGNHDTTRFVSEMNGDAGGDPWTSPPAVPTDPAVYARHRMALALILTLPGLPTLYYGDEVALAGGADPDSRRVMPAEDALTQLQKEVLATARRLGRLRACSAALGSGDRVPLVATRRTYGFARAGVTPGGPPIVALFSTADEPASFALFDTAVPPGIYVDVMTGEEVPVGVAGGEASAVVPPLSFRVLAPIADPCLSSGAP